MLSGGQVPTVLKQIFEYILIQNMSFQNTICCVLHGSVLGVLTFILYINGLKSVSNTLDSIVFADDTNLFISDKNINALFTKRN